MWWHSKFGSNLCKTRGEKHHTAFVKVVEGSNKGTVKRFRANCSPRRDVVRHLGVRAARRPRAAPIRGRAPSQGTVRTEVPLKSAPPRGAPALTDRTPRQCPPVRPPSPFHAHLPRHCRTAALRRRTFVPKVGAAPTIKAVAGHPPARRAPPSAMDNVTTSSPFQVTRDQVLHTSLALTP
jgi:hypothetical protein